MNPVFALAIYSVCAVSVKEEMLCCDGNKEKNTYATRLNSLFKLVTVFLNKFLFCSMLYTFKVFAPAILFKFSNRVRTQNWTVTGCVYVTLKHAKEPIV